MRCSLASSLLAISVVAAAVPAAASPDRLPPFQESISVLDRDIRQLMVGWSWHLGCPVPLRDLRLVRVSYVGFDGRAHQGELVVHRWYAEGFVRVFARLYASRYPIRRMRLVDRYGADDDRSMVADNTSAFNAGCVRVRVPSGHSTPTAARST